MTMQLPRTPAAEAAAHALMAALQAHDAAAGLHQPRYDQEGKMYGVLLAVTPTGEQVILKAFSGWLWGQGEWPGWVPPIPGRQQVALREAATLAQLDDLKQALIHLAKLPARQALTDLEQVFTQEQQTLKAQYAQAKDHRQQQRETRDLTTAELAHLQNQSQTDSRQFRQFKKAWSQRLQPLRDQVAAADRQILALKQQRRQLSQQLQVELHQAYTLQNFVGQLRNLEAIVPNLPTGTGDCCAPKLLQAAAQQGLVPVALAEFWWGPAQVNHRFPQESKVPGQFYEPCAERCQPIMGFLLAGLASDGVAPPRLSPSLSLGEAFAQAVQLANTVPSVPHNDLPLVYEDDWLIIVNKPAGLLSVPGRYHHSQDSVWSRLVQQYPHLRWLHRLDQETSGLLVLAKDLATYQQLYPQWQKRQVEKVYEAIVVGQVAEQQGEITLPLGPDPDVPLRQRVDEVGGKPSQTHFQVMAQGSAHPAQTRLELRPLTGRTHQLRVHLAVGLKTPILGDQLYDCPVAAGRLHLHARALKLWHPQVQQVLSFHAPTPF
jgi:tRNA pseudouridine32 synthase / 23S rRNA pseudouridine746 synthase